MFTKRLFWKKSVVTVGKGHEKKILLGHIDGLRSTEMQRSQQRMLQLLTCFLVGMDELRRSCDTGKGRLRASGEEALQKQGSPIPLPVYYPPAGFPRYFTLFSGQLRLIKRLIWEGTWMNLGVSIEGSSKETHKFLVRWIMVP